MSVNFELRGATILSSASLVTILERMFKGATPDELPQPPEPLTEDFKKRKEKAARVRYFGGMSKDMYITDDAVLGGCSAVTVAGIYFISDGLRPFLREGNDAFWFAGLVVSSS